MPTVIDDDTGEEVEVRPVMAAAAMASVNNAFGEYPEGAAKRIEAAMAAAAHLAISDGIDDPDEIRKRMLDARESAKIAMRNEMRDLRSQEAAAQQGR